MTLSTSVLLQVKKSALDSTMVRIYKEEGLGGLYAGLSSSLYGIAITNGVYCESCRPSAPLSGRLQLPQLPAIDKSTDTRPLPHARHQTSRTRSAATSPVKPEEDSSPSASRSSLELSQAVSRPRSQTLCGSCSRTSQPHPSSTRVPPARRSLTRSEPSSSRTDRAVSSEDSRRPSSSSSTRCSSVSRSVISRGDICLVRL